MRTKSDGLLIGAYVTSLVGGALLTIALLLALDGTVASRNFTLLISLGISLWALAALEGVYVLVLRHEERRTAAQVTS